MMKATEEMLALADKIEYAIKTEGEITLFETNGTRVVYVLRSLAAQSEDNAMTKALLELANELRDAAHYCTEISWLEDRCREVAGKLECLAEDAPEPPALSNSSPGTREALQDYISDWARIIWDATGDQTKVDRAILLADLNGMFDPVKVAGLTSIAQAAWQPIETKPKDHFPVLVWGPFGQRVAFEDVTWTWFEAGAEEPMDDWKPSHWMPLPPRPSVSSTQPPCHGPDDAFCMICNPPMPWTEGNTK